MRMIFINLPVKNLDKSKAFFRALGFTINPQLTNENAASVVAEENVFLQLHTEPHFRNFITGEISDAFKATGVLHGFSAGSRAEVDGLLAKALAAGARPWKPAIDHGFMYVTSFQDLDGHVWEVAWMDPAAIQQS